MRLPARIVSLACLAAAGGVLVGGWAGPAQAAPAQAAPAQAASLRSGPAQAGSARAPAKAIASSPSGVYARGAALENTANGAVMWSRSPDTKRPMGSITKVMTALVVIRAGGLDRVLTVSSAAESYTRRYDGSSAGLHVGDRLSVRQLLEAMLLPSGCDAAYVLANAYGPGLTTFVAKMNALARKLGLGRTHFANFDGLPVPTEYSTYSTPGNLLVIGRAAMASAVFRSIVVQRSYRLTAGSGHHAYDWKNTNLLLGTYAGTTGIKTGSTLAAGYCLLFEARRGSRTLIGVVLDSSATIRAVSFTDAERMLAWGFR